MTEQNFPDNEPVPEAEVILADPATPIWLKDALHAALNTDPVDAANAAEVLFRCLGVRCRSIQSGGMAK